MNCPSCKNAMITKQYEGVEVDECRSCGGIWLDHAEIQVIVKTTEETFSEDQKILAVSNKGQDFGQGKAKQCPKCNKALEAMQYAVTSGVIVDRCPGRHGIYLDKGELDNIQILMEEYDNRYNPEKSRRTSVVPPGVKKCPRDNEGLRLIEYEGEQVDLCPKCKGIWCDGDELGQIIRDREKTFTAEDNPEIVAKESGAERSKEVQLVADLNCVLCSQVMERLNFSYSSGIIVDRCRRGHGVWLDVGELEAVQIFAERWEQQQERVNKQYSKAIKQARIESEKSYGEAMDSISVSMFGPVNRFFRWLAK